MRMRAESCQAIQDYRTTPLSKCFDTVNRLEKKQIMSELLFYSYYTFYFLLRCVHMIPYPWVGRAVEISLDNGFDHFYHLCYGPFKVCLLTLPEE